MNASRSAELGISRNLVSIIFLVGLWSNQAMATSHSYINMMRSGVQSNVLVSQGFEVEYGSYHRRLPEENAVAKDGGEPTDIDSNWKGYGFRTSLGLEMMKFLIVDVGHTYINMRDGFNRLENLSGSRLHAGTRLVFSSPMGNLEAGLGLTGGRYDYQNSLYNSDYYGSGMFYSLGMNYFFSSQVSFYGYGKVTQENLVRNGGSALYKNIRSDTTGFGLGFIFWI
jgi:hypothetical protein